MPAADAVMSPIQTDPDITVAVKPETADQHRALDTKIEDASPFGHELAESGQEQRRAGGNRGGDQ
jgi:hypothetical protein